MHTDLVLPLEIWVVEKKVYEFFFFLTGMEALEEVNFLFPMEAGCGRRFL